MKKASILLLTTLFFGGKIQNSNHIVQSVKLIEDSNSVSMLQLGSEEKGKCKPGPDDGLDEHGCYDYP
jgi:hypothetical protein